MTQISKAAVIFCNVESCKSQDVGTCFKGPELEFEQRTEAYGHKGGINLECLSYEER